MCFLQDMKWNEENISIGNSFFFLTHSSNEWKILFSLRPLSLAIVDQSVSYIIYFIFEVQLIAPFLPRYYSPIVFVVLLEDVMSIYCRGNIHPYFKYGTWWRLFQKRVVRTKFDIYNFITIPGSIPLLVDY
jgi:hypothetical protein